METTRGIGAVPLSGTFEKALACCWSTTSSGDGVSKANGAPALLPRGTATGVGARLSLAKNDAEKSAAEGSIGSGVMTHKVCASRDGT